MRALAAAAASLAFAAAAAAHTTGTHRGFVSTVSRIEPPLPGLLVSVYNGHEQLVVRNLTEKTIRFPHAHVVIPPGRSAAWPEPQIAPTGPPDRQGLIRRWRVGGVADGEPFEVRGYLGYAGPLPDEDEGLPTWAFVAAGAAGAVLIAAALALPLRRRKGEDEATGTP